MNRIRRDQLRAPVKVIEIDVREQHASSQIFEVTSYRSLWCIARVGGVPNNISFWDIGEDEVVSYAELFKAKDLLVDGYKREAVTSDEVIPRGTTVVICTHERPKDLSRALLSLGNQSDSDFRLVVVDNAPISSESREVVSQIELDNCEYIIEPKKGLSRARNTALAHVKTDYVAWMDDDEVADPDWVRALKEGFSHSSKPAAVCGIMVPAELETEAQVIFEQYGGFNKGRGLLPEVLSIQSPAVISPLYPLPAIGSGGNMAFQMAALESIGGFDENLGAGTRTHGGEETRAFASLLLAGETILHWPMAITWHFHRRQMTQLREQFYGYSAGLPAFWASMIRSDPVTVIKILRLAPHVLRDLGILGAAIAESICQKTFQKCCCVLAAEDCSLEDLTMCARLSQVRRTAF